VGSDEYARTNGHYGLTTLRNRHVEVRGPALRFRFLGKSGKTHEVGVQDPRLARIVRECQELPGQRLFQYFDEDGEARQVRADDVNAYLREVSGSDFTAKDFRTWMGTVAVAEALFGCAPPASAKAGKEAVLAAIDGAAARLGNTRAICRKSYVHPAVIDAFMEGEGPGWPPATAPRGRRTPSAGLDRIERATLCLLERAARRRRAPAG
jgi:DNA topoisomerase-1